MTCRRSARRPARRRKPTRSRSSSPTTCPTATPAGSFPPPRRGRARPTRPGSHQLATAIGQRPRHRGRGARRAAGHRPRLPGPGAGRPALPVAALRDEDARRAAQRARLPGRRQSRACSATRACWPGRSNAPGCGYGQGFSANVSNFQWTIGRGELEPAAGARPRRQARSGRRHQPQRQRPLHRPAGPAVVQPARAGRPGPPRGWTRAPPGSTPTCGSRIRGPATARATAARPRASTGRSTRWTWSRPATWPATRRAGRAG